VVLINSKETAMVMQTAKIYDTQEKVILCDKEGLAYNDIKRKKKNRYCAARLYSTMYRIISYELYEILNNSISYTDSTGKTYSLGSHCFQLFEIDTYYQRLPGSQANSAK